MIGKVARCKKGKLGVIIKSKESLHQSVPTMYYGISFDGSKWQSREPEVVADSIDEYISKIRKPIKTIIGIR